MQGRPPSPPPIWTGKLEIGAYYAVWRGAVGDGAMHRHFAAQAVLGDLPVHVIDGMGREVIGKCILIDPLTPHRLKPHIDARLIYIEPHQLRDDRLREMLASLPRVPQPAIVSTAGRSSFWAKQLKDASEPGRSPDARMAATLNLIDTLIPHGLVSISELAAPAGLSADRFRHDFGAQVGLSPGRYVLWRRLRLAATELQQGADVTTAAHAAGFADAAHYARTMKATFGVTAMATLRKR